MQFLLTHPALLGVAAFALASIAGLALGFAAAYGPVMRAYDKTERDQ